MTKVEEIVRAVGRKCRGRIGSKLRPRPTEADAVEMILRKEIVAALNDNDVVRARAIDNETRAECGYDFNDTIMGGPLDGKEQDYVCPRCGVKGTYRAPLFDLE